MKFELFHQQLKKYSNQYGDLTPFKGNVSDVILLKDLYERETTSNLIKSMLEEGRQYKTAHLTTKEQLQEIGLEATEEYYISSQKTSLTQPVLIPL